jgi:hypothetical protein
MTGKTVWLELCTYSSELRSAMHINIIAAHAAYYPCHNYGSRDAGS